MLHHLDCHPRPVTLPRRPGHTLQRYARLLAIGIGLGLIAFGAQAGRTCNTSHPPSARTLEHGMALAQRTATALDASGAQVVLLGRAGQDLRRYGVRYSHLGWAYKTPQGLWRVAHKLNDCGLPHAAVYRQGLGEFFLDDLWRHEAVWAVPTPAVQARLLPLLRERPSTLALHQPAYSMVSYAWGTRYQQSNQWALETFAAAMLPGGGGTEVGLAGDSGAGSEAAMALRPSRVRAQAWLRAYGYTPAMLHIGPLTRLGARVGAGHIAFDDHPPAQRYAGRIETVTVDSVLAWLEKAELVNQVGHTMLP